MNVEERWSMQPRGKLAADQKSFDMFAEALISQPYAAYADLRSSEPVHWDPSTRAWILTGYEDTRTVLQDETFKVPDTARSIRTIAQKSGRNYDALADFFETIPFFRNAEAHRQARSMFVKVLARMPPRLLEAAARQFCSEVARELSEKTRYDAMSDFAEIVPHNVMATLLGLSSEDAAALNDRASLMTMAFDTVSLALFDQIEQQMIQSLSFIAVKIESAMRSGTESGLSTIYNNSGGEGSGRMRNAAAAALYAYKVGTETTTGLIGSMVRLLLEDPTLRRRARADPAVRPAIVSELIRLEGSVQRLFRICPTDRVLGGRQIIAGDLLILLVGASNRDPSVFPDPDDVVLQRRGPAHLAFGKGIHFCSGAALSQMELTVALDVMLSLPEVERDGEETWYDNRVVRRLTRLPVRTIGGGAQGIG